MLLVSAAVTRVITLFFGRGVYGVWFFVLVVGVVLSVQLPLRSQRRQDPTGGEIFIGPRVVVRVPGRYQSINIPEAPLAEVRLEVEHEPGMLRFLVPGTSRELATVPVPDRYLAEARDLVERFAAILPKPHTPEPIATADTDHPFGPPYRASCSTSEAGETNESTVAAMPLSHELRASTVACVGDARVVGHELVEPCPRCGALVRGVLGQTVVGDRLAWSIASSCEGCGSRSQSCEWDEMPDELRRVLLDRDGVTRLRVDPGSGCSLRLPILRVLRRYGATLAEAGDAYTRLTGAGVTGTPAEMRLLSSRLNTIGATTHLDP
jgi:hypothetical protein